MKQKLKIIFILTVVALIISAIITPHISKAESSLSFTIDDVIKNGDDFLRQGEKEVGLNEGELHDMSNSIYNVLLAIGIITAVIVGLILGIKFITGGIEEQAQVKQMLIPYVVGCVVVFAAFTIWRIVVDLLQSM